MLNWSDPKSNPIQDLRDAKKSSNELIVKSYNDAIEFAINNRDYAAEFLELWSHGEWSEIRKYYPEFNLDSEAQKHLIAASGGEQL